MSKPGPGFYDVKDSNRGPAYSIKGRQSERHDNSKPGPGHYDAIDSAVKHQNPAHDFSRSPDRSRSGSPHKDGLPGPGQYDNRDYNLAGH